MQIEKVDVGKYFISTIWRGWPLTRMLKQWNYAQDRIQTLPKDEYRAIQTLGMYFYVERRKGARLSEIASEFLHLLEL